MLLKVTNGVILIATIKWVLFVNMNNLNKIVAIFPFTNELLGDLSFKSEIICCLSNTNKPIADMHPSLNMYSSPVPEKCGKTTKIYYDQIQRK